MKKTGEIADKETLVWLLEEENPSVRFFTLTQLLKKPLSEKVVKEAGQDIMKRGLVPEILSLQTRMAETRIPADVPDRYPRDT